MTFGEGNILYLDTAGDELMVGMSAGGAMLFRHRETSSGGPSGGSQRYHSAILIPTIETGLKRIGIDIQDLTAVCVNVGPGSFTGIRTGIASVRTLGQFLPKLAGQLYAFNTFEILRGSMMETGGGNQPAVSIYINALRDRAYHAMVGLDSTGPFYVKEPALIPLQDRPEDKLPVVVSEALKESHFAHCEVGVTTIESLNVFTPDVMQRLLAEYGDHFKHPWREVGPLYLQEPNITQRKAKPGKIS